MDDDLLCKFQDILDTCNASAHAKHPEQSAMGLKEVTVKLAALVCSQEQINAANDGMWGTFTFTAEQEKEFAILQIQMNSYLDLVATTAQRIPLLHLSPRMLLNSQLPVEQRNSNCMTECSVGLKKKHKKRRHQRKASNSLSATKDGARSSPMLADERGSLSEFSSASEGSLMTESSKSNVSCDTPMPLYSYTVSQEKYDAICSKLLHTGDRKCIDDACTLYEELLARMRDQHDSIQQSLNMRLFIAQTEVANLKDQLLVRTSINALS